MDIGGTVVDNFQKNQEFGKSKREREESDNVLANPTIKPYEIIKAATHNGV